MSIGLILFVFKDGSDFIDCNSWQKIYHTNFSSTEGETVKPFYNRVGEISTPFYDWSDHTLGDFDTYYKNLENKK